MTHTAQERRYVCLYDLYTKGVVFILETGVYVGMAEPLMKRRVHQQDEPELMSSSPRRQGGALLLFGSFV